MMIGEGMNRERYYTDINSEIYKSHSAMRS